MCYLSRWRSIIGGITCLDFEWAIPHYSRTCHTLCCRPVIMEGCFAAVGTLMMSPRALTANSSVHVDWTASVRTPTPTRTMSATSSAHSCAQDPGSLGSSCAELSPGSTLGSAPLRRLAGSLCSYGFYSLQVHDTLAKACVARLVSNVHAISVFCLPFCLHRIVVLSFIWQ